MKTLVYLILLSLLPILATAQTVPNGDLENWTNGSPDGWNTGNNPGYMYTVQSPIAQNGSSSANYQIISSAGTPVWQVLRGPLVPISTAPVSMTFWYQFTCLGADSLEFGAGVMDSFYVGTAVANAQVTSFQPTSVWTPITVPFVYHFNPVNPDTVFFTFIYQDRVGGGFSLGTYALLDHFSVHFDVAGFWKAIQANDIAFNLLGSVTAFIKPNQNTNSYSITILNALSLESATRFFLNKEKQRIEGLVPSHERDDIHAPNLGGTLNCRWIWEQELT